MEGLNFNSIFDDSELSIEDIENVEDADKKENEETDEGFDTITDVEDLVLDDQQESVSDEDEDNDDSTREKEDAKTGKTTGTSPITFSSIAGALAEEGVFPDLEEEDINNVKTSADFVSVIKKQIESQLDETQKRILSALDAGVEPSAIKGYENTLKYLGGINVDSLSAENEEAELLRKRLIFQDYINKGLSKERAEKLTQRSVDSGTDVEDAREALESNIEFFKSEYSNLVNSAKKEAEEERKETEKRSAELKKSMLEDEKLFGDLVIDKSLRQKAFDNISKPVFKDKETGDVYTAVQKYEKDNPTEFLKYVGMFFTLTNGFKEMGNLIKGAVKKENKKGMKALEQALNSTVRTSDGRLDFLSGLHDPESSSSKFTLDI